MGIPRLFGGFIRSFAGKYPGILQAQLPRQAGEITSLSIDANALFHPAINIIYHLEKPRNESATDKQRRDNLRRALNECNSEMVMLQAFSLIFDLILQIVEAVVPSQVLVIAVDGAIPMPKVQQQKQRRYRAGLELEKDATFDRNAISPGTLFMQKLDEFLKFSLAQEYGKRIQVPKVVYSSYRDPGEGEHKIFEYFRDGTIPGVGSHVIWGLDADLIAISLVSQVPNLILVRDAIGLKYKDRLINRPFRPKKEARPGEVQEDQNEILYVEELTAALNQEVGRPSGAEEFVFALSLVGNDFLPKSFAFRNVDTSAAKVTELLGGLSEPLVTQGQPNPAAVLAFLEKVASAEPELLDAAAAVAHLVEVPMEKEARDPDGLLNQERFRQLWYVNALGLNGLDRIPALQTGPLVAGSDLATMCYHYLKGFYWVYSYYRHGQNSVSWQWSYPFRYAPLVRDLVAVAPELLQDAHALEVSPAPDERRIGILEQLVAVMPYYSLWHVPPALRGLWSESSPLVDLMPLNFPVDNAGTDQSWEALELVPMASFERITKAVDELRLPDALRSAYAQLPPVVLEGAAYEARVRDYRARQQGPLRYQGNRPPRGDRGGSGPSRGSPRPTISEPVSAGTPRSEPDRGGRGRPTTPERGGRGGRGSDRGGRGGSTAGPRRYEDLPDLDALLKL